MCFGTVAYIGYQIKRNTGSGLAKAGTEMVRKVKRGPIVKSSKLGKIIKSSNDLDR